MSSLKEANINSAQLKRTIYKTLHNLAIHLAIVPNVDLITKQEHPTKNLYLIINFVLATLIISYVSFSRYVYFYNRVAISAYVGYVFVDIMSYIQVICNIFNTYIYRKDIAKCYHHFEKISETLGSVKSKFISELTVKHTKQYTIEIVVAHCMVVLYLAFNWYQWNSNMGMGVSFLNLIKDLLYYHLLFNAIMMRIYIGFIKYEVVILKHILKNMVAGSNYRGPLMEMFIAEGTITVKHKNWRDNWSMEKIQSIFGEIYELIDDFNRVYGCPIVICFANMMINIIMPINLILLYGSGNRELSNVNYFILVSLMWLTFPLILGATLLTVCQQCINEIREIPKICYALGRRVDVKTKADLHDLAAEINILSPCFNASGLFVVNYGLVTSMFTAVVSYIIVLMQFNNLV